MPPQTEPEPASPAGTEPFPPTEPASPLPPTEPDVPASAEADREKLVRFLENCYYFAELGLGYTYDCEAGMQGYDLLTVCTGAYGEYGEWEDQWSVRADRAVADWRALHLYHLTQEQLDTAILGWMEGPDGPYWSVYRIERRSPADFDWEEVYRVFLETRAFRDAPINLPADADEDGPRATFCLADLNGDGTPELLLDTNEGEPRGILVLGLSDGEITQLGTIERMQTRLFWVIPDSAYERVFLSSGTDGNLGGISYYALDPDRRVTETVICGYAPKYTGSSDRKYTWYDCDEALKDLVSAPEKLPMYRVSGWYADRVDSESWKEIVRDYETRAENGDRLSGELPAPEGLEDFLRRILHYADGNFPDGPSVVFPSEDFDVL